MTERRLAMVAKRGWIIQQLEFLPTRPAYRVSAPTDVRWSVLLLTVITGAWVLTAFAEPVRGQSPAGDEAARGNLKEPVYRVSKAPDETDRSGHGATQGSPKLSNRQRSDSALRETPRPDRLAANTSDSPLSSRELPKPHPLDPALEIARDALTRIENEIHDYTCLMVKRERVNGELLEHEFMTCKVRHARTAGQQAVPFSVYLGFRKPDAIRGREVIYVAGQNNGKLVAHEGGFKGRLIPTMQLLPTSALAMRGNRYPITEIGIETLTRRLIEKGERDRKLGDCRVRLVDGAKIDGRMCTMLEVKHTEKKQAYDFHLARVFMDKQLKVPIRYESYDWPIAGGNPPLQEEYTYMNLKVNVGLGHADFDIENPSYRF